MSFKHDLKTLPAKKFIDKYVGKWYERKSISQSHLMRKIVKFDFEKNDIFRQDDFWYWYCSLARFDKLYYIDNPLDKIM